MGTHLLGEGKNPLVGKQARGFQPRFHNTFQFSCIFIPPCLKDHNPETDLKFENTLGFCDSGYGFSQGFIRKCMHTTLHYYV